MRVQKVGSQQLFGMAHKVDYTGITPVEEAALNESGLSEAFRDVDGTVLVSKRHHKDGKWVFPANRFFNLLFGKNNKYRTSFVFELPPDRSLVSTVKHLSGIEIDAVYTSNIKGKDKEAITRVLQAAISQVKMACQQKMPRRMTEAVRASCH